MRSEEIGWWVSASGEDEKAVGTLMEAGQFSLAVFHAQQAAEKRLKALCVMHRRPGHTHSCVLLLKKLEAMGVAPPDEALAAARRLDHHYVNARYPNGLGLDPVEYYDRRFAEEAMEWMQTLMSFADSKLAEEIG